MVCVSVGVGVGAGSFLSCLYIYTRVVTQCYAMYVVRDIAYIVSITMYDSVCDVQCT